MEAKLENFAHNQTSLIFNQVYLRKETLTWLAVLILKIYMFK